MTLPPAAYAGALAALPGIGPATLFALLAHASPPDVWDAVRRGEVVRPLVRGGARSGGAGSASRAGPASGAGSASGPGPASGPGSRQSWAEAAARAPVGDWWDGWQRRGVGVTWPGDTAYPDRLRTDPEPPGVLFWRGRLEHLAGRCVAVVGTRRCSPDGRATAYDMGHDLAAAGVCVVSGLALGIDGAAHMGALRAATADGEPGRTRSAVAPRAVGRTVGVAASGVDVAYPARHAALWEHVAAEGAVLSETPPGRPAQAWRFPARNRVIAGLVDLVVVVESHRSGGSLITAEKAIDRGIEVRVVPGPVHAPSAAGSNQLLYDGPGPVRDACDVLDALGMVAARPRSSGRRRRAGVGRADLLRLPVGGGMPPLGGAGPHEGAAPTGGPPRSEGEAPPPEGPPPAAPPPGAPPPGAPPPAAPPPATPPPAAPPPAAPPPDVAAVIEAVGWRPVSLNRIIERSGLGVAAVVRLLEGLATTGEVHEEAGWWVRDRQRPSQFDAPHPSDH